MKKMKSNQAALANDPRRDGFASADAAAHFLDVSRAMITKQVNAGKMPHRRFGRALRIPWSWLLDEVERAANPQGPKAA